MNINMVNEEAEKVETNESSVDGSSLQYVESVISVADTQDSDEDRQEKFSWEEVLFLPYNIFWIIPLFATILIHCAWIIYRLAFNSGKEQNTNSICKLKWPIEDYAFDLFFLVDWLLALIYYKWKSLNTISMHAPRRTLFLAVDIVALLPLDTAFYLFYNHDPLCRTLYTFKLYRIIRLYRLVNYFYVAHLSIGQKEVLLCVFELFTYLLVLAHVYASVLYLISCTDSSALKCGMAWSIRLQHKLKMNITNGFEWCTVCLYEVLGHATSKGFSDLKTDDIYIKYLILSISILYLLIMCGILIGYLTSAIMQEKKKPVMFSQRMEAVENHMKSANIRKSTCSKVVQFYDVYWKKRGGVGETINVEMLPHILWNELCLDMYWDTFRHSHLFKSMNLPFLRMISLYIKSEFLLPGYVIYKSHMPKNKMIYLVSGEIQILSNRDDQTPIISFSGGTCIGEASLLFSYMNDSIVQCLSYCEINIIDRRDFYSIMKRYPQELRFFREKIQLRVRRGRELHNIAHYLDTHLITHIDKPLISPMRWVKDTLIRFMTESGKDFSTSKKKRSLTSNTSSFGDIQFTTRYLDLYALSEELQLVTDAIFLKTTCPWILQPNSVLVNGLEYAMAFIATVMAILLPYYAVFLGDFPDWLSMMVYICQVVYVFDLCIQISTAIRTKDSVISEWRQIFFFRFTEPVFIADIICAIPFFILGHLMEDDSTLNHLGSLFTLTQLFKLWKLAHVISKFEKSLMVAVNLIRLIKYTCYIIFTIYFSSALLYISTCFNQRCIHDGWIKHSNNLIPGVKDHFLKALYFGTMLITGVAYDDIKPGNLKDMTLLLFLYLISFFIFIYMIAGLSATQTLSYRPIAEFEGIIKRIKHGMSRNNVDKRIQDRVYHLIDTKWRYNKGARLMFGISILSDLPTDIVNEMKISSISQLLSQVPIFENESSAFINRVATISTQYVFPSNEIVSYSGQVNKKMYILQKGYCEIITVVYGKSEKVIKGPGSNFSVVEMCLNIPVVNTVRTLTYCNIISIKYEDLFCIMTEFPELQKQFRDVIDSSMGLLELYDFQSEKHFVDVTVTKTEEVKSSWKYFGYSLVQGTPAERDYMIPFMKLKYLSFVRFFLLRLTFHPQGKFIFCWEIGRVIFALISTLLYPVHELLRTLWGNDVVLIISFTLAGTAVADLYIRLHCCYYNSKGILVTHPLKTAVYYIKHAFFTDLIACLPLHFFIYAENNWLHEFLSTLKYLQCYRIIKGANYIESNVLRPSHIITVFKFFVIVILFCNAVGSMFVMRSCEFVDLNIGSNNPSLYAPGVYCLKNRWISLSKYRKPLSPIRVYLYGLYWAFSTVTRSAPLGFSCKTGEEIILTNILAIIGIVSTIYIYSSIVSSRSSLNVDLSTYQEKMRSLVYFMTDNNIANDLKREVINYFELMWQRKRGKPVHIIFNRFPTPLYKDILFDIFGQSVQECQAFKKTSKAFIRNLLEHSQHRIYLKGARIITKNDVIGTINFLHKGHVVVTAADGTRLCVMKIGSIFGNLDNTPAVRQTATFSAKGHVEVLEIESTKFHKLLSDYPVAKRRFENLTILNTDYVLSTLDNKGQRYTLENAAISSSLDEVKNSPFASLRVSLSRGSVYSPHSRFSIMCQSSFIIGSIINYIVISYQIALLDYSITPFIISYVFDVLYLFKIHFKLHLAYEDEFGEVTDLKKIRKRYIYSSTGLFLDIASTVPLDVIALGLQYQFWAAILRINRFLRLIFVLQYFQVTRNKLNINVSLMRFGYIVSCILIVLHFFACWLVILDNLSDVQKVINQETRTFGDRIFQYSSSLYIAVKMFTSTSAVGLAPDKAIVILCLIVMILVSQLVVAVFIGEACAVMEILRYTRSKYAREIETLKKYFKIHDLSPALINQVWSYVCVMWKIKLGKEYPKLLDEAPYYLKEGIKKSIYGFHIEQNPIFSECHSDFLRQLISTLVPITFLPGNYITFKGDTDNCMYFIHSGEVEVLIQGKLYSEDIQEVLKHGDVFGLIQGLFPKEPQLFTYRARTVCTILVLNSNDWLYLLDYFPASRARIYEEANFLPL